jgi:hypothetical protein
VILATACPCCASTKLTSYPAILAPFIAHRVFGRDCEVQCGTLACNDCGLIFQAYRYVGTEMLRLYMDYRSTEYVATRARYEEHYPEVDKWLEGIVPYMPEIEAILTPHLTFPVSVLDWGGDDGHNAPFADKRSLLHVYDIGNKSVIEGATAIAFPTARRYDLVVCANLLEHVPYPTDTLQDIKGSMDSHSILYIEVPYETARYHIKDFLADGIWHEHINYFSRQSIIKMLAMCGIKILEIREVVANLGRYTTIQFLMACKLAGA